MKKLTRFACLSLLLLTVPAYAQESVASSQVGDPATPSSSQPSGLLTPPPDPAPGTATTAPAPTAVVSPGKPTATTTTTTTTVTVNAKASIGPMSSREIARIQQQEIIRRQELEFRANEALHAAQKAELASQMGEARKNYLFAAEAYGSVSRATSSYAKAAEGLTRVDFQLYDDALQTGDANRAKQLIDEVVKYNPNNKMAQERLVKVNHALADPNDTSIFGNVAVTPHFVKQVNEVQRLFDEAEQFRRTGQWDLAEVRLKRILGIDPYNIGATKQLEQIEAQKTQYADTARLQTRDERLRQVEEKWYEPINNKDVTTTTPEDEPRIVRATNFDLDQKLKGITVSLNFDDATIESATNFLSIESKRLDEPDHKGVNFIIQPEASSSAKPISLTLNNVPLGEALRYVCQLAGVKYKVQDYAISIVPFSLDTEDLTSRTFIVQPSFVAPPSAATTTGGAGSSAFGNARPITPITPANATLGAGDTVRAALEAKGIKFPPGASAVYTAANQQLTVVDTADQMELIEELANAGLAPTLMVSIAAKFVEINQEDLNDLTVNSAFSFNGELHGKNLLPTAGSFTTELPGANAFSIDSIDQLISPPSTASTQLNFRGFINDYQYNVVLTALSQKKSFDLLSEPSVLTKSGEQGTIEAIRVFPYPIAFDPPETVTPPTTTTVGGPVITNPPTVIPTTPTDFKRRNVGVRLVVKPQITPDNKTVDLSLFPEVTDFEGFINYGSPIFVGNPVISGVDATSLLSANVINQPVFNTRRINTKVLVHDGSTVVLGGLIREDLQNVNDKVPILGDIPLIGRLFQSKATKSTKRNLIIFVTANIYRNDGELLNPPEIVNAADVLTGHAAVNPVVRP
jgi:general secretion pathway protein D